MGTFLNNYLIVFVSAFEMMTAFGLIIILKNMVMVSNYKCIN